ncbi:peptidase U32 family protein [Candidatus Margulisiibacteriota bacterium]
MNRKYLPEIVIFVKNPVQVEEAIKSGADHLVLEDPKVSARSFQEDQSSKDFTQLKRLANLAGSLKKDIMLSFNLDILAKEKDFPIIKRLLKNLKKIGICFIRIQDPGLSLLIREVYPEAKLYLATETGNTNTESIKYFSSIFQRQIFSNEIPYPDLLDITRKIESEFEIQVQGPVLMQQSSRKYLTICQKVNSNKVPLISKIRDLDHPQRELSLYENMHGSFCYLDYDCCLFHFLDQLAKLKLTGWLIDPRGESNDYFKASIKLYKKARDLMYNKKIKADLYKKDSEIKSLFLALQKSAQRPFSEGFFQANNTDQNRKAKLTCQEPLGIVLDVIKNEIVTLQLYKPIKSNDLLLAINPEGKKFGFKAQNMTDMENNQLTISGKREFIKIKWYKGFQPRTLIY